MQIKFLLNDNPEIELSSPAAIAAALKLIESNIAWVADFAAPLQAFTGTS